MLTRVARNTCIKVALIAVCLSLCSCYFGTCLENWSGTYSASLIRNVEGCVDPIEIQPSVDKAIISERGDEFDQWYKLRLQDQNSPDCTIYFSQVDDVSAGVEDAQDCEGGVVPYGFNIGGGVMTRDNGTLNVDLEWWKYDETDCWLYDTWSLN